MNPHRILMREAALAWRVAVENGWATMAAICLGIAVRRRHMACALHFEI